MSMVLKDIKAEYYRVPVPESGDAGHGTISSEELIIVTLQCDGLEGEGYAYTIGRGGRAIQALIEHDLAPLVRGRDVSDAAATWEHMWRSLLYVGRGGLAAFAVAAVDIAVWDLLGRRDGDPLHALLGTEPRSLAAYGSGVDLPKPTDELLAQVAGFLERGFSAVKVKVGRPDPREDERRVDAVRRLVGQEAGLMVDANMALTCDQAIELGRRLRPFSPTWFEEPLAPEDVGGHARLMAELDVPIAIGESLHAVSEFGSYLDRGAASIVQVDPITNGGITAVTRVIGLANAAGVEVSSHYADELNAHLLCMSDHARYLEKHAFALDPYLVEPQEVVDGRVRPSGAPGTGVRFDRAALERVAGGGPR